jgi:thiol:disulfide interchange protein DsbD
MTRLFVLSAVACVALSGSAQAQADPLKANPVHWTAKAPAKAARAGATATVTLATTIDKGWHVYALSQGPGGPLPMRMTVPDKQAFALGGKIVGSTPFADIDPSGVAVEFYKEKASFAVPLKVDPTLKPGTYTAKVSTRYQVCSDRLCLPPQTVTLEVPLTVGAAPKSRKSIAG